MKEEWRSVWFPGGVEFVLRSGVTMMLQLFVGSLVIHHMVSEFNLVLNTWMIFTFGPILPQVQPFQMGQNLDKEMVL